MPSLRCAIYTRKSSEEGLDQSFNSLDAQREACEAYVESQRQEGWRLVRARFDDGGFSGGTMERPGLTRLLDEIAAGKIDIVVVYKVDRLTRSLSDFAKMIDCFDARNVSFVSVTQQFNTTSSMGRLTLNVLLSFAQFEREVTGERIRDKIAASKAKGMWMGGNVPLGFDIENRKLLVNEREARCVRFIFETYLEFGNVRELQTHLASRGLVGKVRVASSGQKRGGQPLSRGALYRMLSNPIYIGKVKHRGNVYEGEHESILNFALWERVQKRLASNRIESRNRSRASSPSLLAGILFDAAGNPLTPSHTMKDNKRYRYYVSQSTEVAHGDTRQTGLRLPAADIEDAVRTAIADFVCNSESMARLLPKHGPRPPRPEPVALRKKLRTVEEVRSLVRRIEIANDELAVWLNQGGVATVLQCDVLSLLPDDRLKVSCPIVIRRRHGMARIESPGDIDDAPSEANLALVKAVIRTWDWNRRLLQNEMLGIASLAREEGISEAYIRNHLSLSGLAPRIVRALVDGKMTSTMPIAKLAKALPLDWHRQERLFVRTK